MKWSAAFALPSEGEEFEADFLNFPYWVWTPARQLSCCSMERRVRISLPSPGWLLRMSKPWLRNMTFSGLAQNI